MGVEKKTIYADLEMELWASPAARIAQIISSKSLLERERILISISRYLEMLCRCWW